jgi:AraC family transcriptional regulator of adaptative response/methylated-DNA-[protein]-cysteine methyltransferase
MLQASLGRRKSSAGIAPIRGRIKINASFSAAGGRRLRYSCAMICLPTDEDSLYAALLARDAAYEGSAYVGVITTGIFCRLTCPARKPKRQNVRFYAAPDQAEAAGFRACQRCRPLDSGLPRPASVETLRAQVLAASDQDWSAAQLKRLGYDPSTVRRAFQRVYGMSFTQFVRTHRLGNALSQLTKGGSVIDAQLDAGYESASGFRDAVTRLIGTAPAQGRARNMLSAQWLETPLGPMLAVADETGLHLLEFADRVALPGELERLNRRVGSVCFAPHPLLTALAETLAAYFAGRWANFNLPLAAIGSAFYQQVWAELRQIPAGVTISYKVLAERIGRPTAMRAVAQANGANPIAILVPCHRVIGADGKLVGYGGKLWRKRWLLNHERHFAPPPDLETETHDFLPGLR